MLLVAGLMGGRNEGKKEGWKNERTPGEALSHYSIIPIFHTSSLKVSSNSSAPQVILMRKQRNIEAIIQPKPAGR
jgi:hypothetical protein